MNNYEGYTKEITRKKLEQKKEHAINMANACAVLVELFSEKLDSRKKLDKSINNLLDEKLKNYNTRAFLYYGGFSDTKYTYISFHNITRQHTTYKEGLPFLFSGINNYDEIKIEICYNSINYNGEKVEKRENSETLRNLYNYWNNQYKLYDKALLNFNETINVINELLNKINALTDEKSGLYGVAGIKDIY